MRCAWARDRASPRTTSSRSRRWLDIDVSRESLTGRPGRARHAAPHAPGPAGRGARAAASPPAHRGRAAHRRSPHRRSTAARPRRSGPPRPVGLARSATFLAGVFFAAASWPRRSSLRPSSRPACLRGAFLVDAAARLAAVAAAGACRATMLARRSAISSRSAWTSSARAKPSRARRPLDLGHEQVLHQFAVGLAGLQDLLGQLREPLRAAPGQAADQSDIVL